ncbi:hypothetical protein KIW84_032115 [Lathyrus oleraceus]|uniref:Uncharacterized protein n=1 Tax=Pisum sativum TaxID=3888 RepID=A0A9D4XT17_PEA|nr:hypothetical protein KIW84_032115 [Pisum sativum]
MATRRKYGIVQPRVHPTLLLTELESSTTYKMAMKDPKWMTAMNEEYSALLRNQTWTLISLPPNWKAIRPEKRYVVNKVCQFLYQPLNSHWIVVKRILRYLKGTLHHGMLLQPTSTQTPFSIGGFSDADWGSYPDDMKSTSGSCIFLGPNLVSWWSKKKILVARSSTKVEYKSLANSATEVLWIQSLLAELKIPSTTPVTFCDNLSTIAMSQISLSLHTLPKWLCGKKTQPYGRDRSDLTGSS